MTRSPGAEWLDSELASSWTAADSQGEFLDVPRKISAVLVANERPDAAVVVDIGSGPGAYLETMLDVLPRAEGVWSDLSPTMAEIARERLARFGDRVRYELADMTDLSAIRDGVDVMTTSRASHHLEAAGLAAFYADAATHLAPGGWIVNLDHVTPEPGWNDRLRAARKTLIPPSATPSSHAHPNPLPTVADHLDGLAAAGLVDVVMPWRGLYTCLFLARRP